MGWADALSRLNIPYDSPEAIKLAEETSLFIERIAWDESASLAEGARRVPRVRELRSEAAAGGRPPPPP